MYCVQCTARHDPVHRLTRSVLAGSTFEGPVPLVLPTCCGMEFLFEAERYVALPGALLCVNASGSTVVLRSLSSHAVICPCVASAASAMHLNMSNGVVTTTSAVCAELGTWRLVDGVCRSLPSCGVGQRVRLQGLQSLGTAALVCVAGVTQLDLVETACEGKCVLGCCWLWCVLWGCRL